MEIKKIKIKYKEEKAKLKAKYKEKKASLKSTFKLNKLNFTNNKKTDNRNKENKKEEKIKTNKKDKENNKNINTNIEESKFELPRYTKGEEIFNMASHIVGAGLAIAALIVTLMLSIRKNLGTTAILSSIIYSLSMLVLYTMSSIYHGLSPKLKTAKNLFRKFDYISIFILIAGSYTMFSLMSLRYTDPKSAWILFGIQWGVTLIGAILNAISVKKFIVLSNIMFLVMGWSVVWKIKEIKTAMHPTGFLFLFLGGIAYTLGVIFYILGKKKKWMHSIFHLFVLLGSILHFISIVCYVL